jgi:hypothetical protein
VSEVEPPSSLVFPLVVPWSDVRETLEFALTSISRVALPDFLRSQLTSVCDQSAPRVGEALDPPVNVVVVAPFCTRDPPVNDWRVHFVKRKLLGWGW